MRVLAVSKDDNLIFKNEDILIQKTSSNAYDIPLRFELTIKHNIENLQTGEVYKLYIYNYNNPLELTLYKIDKDILDDKIYMRLIFMHKEFYTLLTNKVTPEKTQILGVKFKDVLRFGSNQLAFFFLKLRTRTGFLSINSNTLLFKDKFVNSAFSITNSNVASVSNRAVVKYLNSSKFLKKNYYTILENGEIVATKNGKGSYIYLAFATKSDIAGLDIYLIPQIQIETTDTNLVLGDVVQFENKNYVVNHIEYIYTISDKKVIYTLSVNIKELQK